MSNLTVNYPSDFVKAATELIDKWEGGYVNDPADPSGETNACRKMKRKAKVKQTLT